MARRAAVVAGLILLLIAGPAHAQLSQLAGAASGQSKSDSDQPVTFTADSVEYDRDNALVTAKGHVEAWQNGHILRADSVTFDRNTGVAAAHGNVVLMEPDGQVLFADYAEMSQGMKDGVMRDMRAILAQNGRLAANGARRTGGEINEMSRAVYSTCNLCAKDPTKPPLWEIRAFSAVQDLEHKKIEFQDAVMDMYGIPVAYFPYFWTADPSVKRESGLLIPSMGAASHIGAFYAQPYYWVIDDQSDATFTPMITTQGGPQLDIEYRRKFNNGALLANVSGAYFQGQPQGSLYLNGQFNFDESWRWGFNINRASSENYVNDFHMGQDFGTDPNLLTSQLYVEGFGQGAYSRLDTRFYQGLTTSIVNSKLPLVLPNYQYSYFGQPDALGGRLSLDAGAFNVERTDGTNTRRVSLTTNWERPFTGALGDLWKITLHNDAVGYNASDLNQQPTFSPNATANNGRDLPQLAIDYRWPFMRSSGAWGTQIIEPIAQIIVAPQTGDSQVYLYPNEDSLDQEFTDTNLFGFNRFPGIDRLEGGQRVNYAMHTAWYLNGTTLDSLVGQSYRPYKDNLFPQASGLHDQLSDVVGHVTLSPAPWLDMTYRTRLDQKSFATRMADAVATVGVDRFRVNGGYIYTTYNPYTQFDQPQPPPIGSAFYVPRNEITLGATSKWGAYRFSAYARRDLQTNQMVATGADAVYEDECFIVDLKYYRRYTSINNDGGSQSLLLQLTFKTIGTFGYRTL